MQRKHMNLSILASILGCLISFASVRAEVCTPEYWCWKNPTPFGWHINAMWTTGTGDVFASVLLGRLLCEEGFGTALYKAGDFVAEAIAATQELNLPVREGLAFEHVIEQVNL